MRLKRIQLVLLAGVVGGCAQGGKPFIAMGSAPATAPSTSADVTPPNTTLPVAETTPSPAPLAPAQAVPAPVVATTPATTQPVATSELGSGTGVPGLAPEPKPFIAIPKVLQISSARPSALLLEHASPDSPVPLSDYGKQPTHSVGEFNLRADLSVQEVTKLMGPPAQLADAGDPWLVYRLAGSKELWLHFTGPLQSQLDAADVIRGAENGYVRTRVFSADDTK